MSRKYKFWDQQKLYFVSFAVVYWLDPRCRPLLPRLSGGPALCVCRGMSTLFFRIQAFTFRTCTCPTWNMPL
jgi:hypothetical protein